MRYRVYIDPRDNNAIVHEVDNRQYQIGESMTLVSLMCGIRVQRHRTYLSDDEPPNCMFCLAHETQ